MSSWFRIHRVEDLKKLLKKPNEFALLVAIASRVRYQDDRFGELKKGQCYVSAKTCGMSQRTYRTAKENLEKWGFASFVGTNKSTIATLLDESVVNVFGDKQTDRQPDKPEAPPQEEEEPKPDKQPDNLKDKPTHDWYIDKFNELKGKARKRKSTHKKLTSTALSNLNKLFKAGYSKDDFIMVIEEMLKADYPKQHGIDNPEHVARNENFSRYWNKANNAKESQISFQDQLGDNSTIQWKE